KAKQVDGPSYLHIHTPCPTGWGFEPALSIEVAKAAVQTGAWTLMEFENGERRVTRKITKLKPVESYVKLQRRFKKLTEKDIKNISQEIKRSLES
ncbi:MAG: pyruvate synthase subunit beta, partial [bacterium]|nr:pyruvate synthase subunit beta [bacterium]